MLSIVREERQRMMALTSLGLTPDQAFNLLTDDDIATAMTEPEPMMGIVDAGDKIEGGGVITWWNNIEKDKRCGDALLSRRWVWTCVLNVCA